MQNNIITKKEKSRLHEWISLLSVICIALVIRIFIMEPFVVPTASMKATILENDYIISTKYNYGYSNYSLSFLDFLPIFKGRILASPPKRGDIIIFRPPHNIGIRYIKRLVGLPGDKIQLIDNVIYINDQKVQRTQSGIFTSEAGVKYTKYKETLPNGVSYFTYEMIPISTKLIDHRYSNTDAFYVPDGKYFFLGDNRYESNDSRFDLGFVPFENFIAKAQFIWFSTKMTLWDANAGIFNLIKRIKPWILSIRVNRIFQSLYEKNNENTDKTSNDRLVNAQKSETKS